MTTRSIPWPRILAEGGAIVVSILLAFGIQAWWEGAQEREEERATLQDLRADLVDNVTELDRNLHQDSLRVVGIDTVLTHIEARLPYSDGLSEYFAELENWASPYFTRAAYETLKGRGVGLIRDRSLRNAIVNLYEQSYTFLISDQDREEWVHLEAVVLPVTTTRIEEMANNVVRLIDYESLLDDDVFRIAMQRSSALRQYGLELKAEARQRTLEVIETD